MARKPQHIETVDIGFSRGLHVHVDLALDEVTVYHLMGSGRRKTWGTSRIDEFMAILAGRKTA